MPDAWITADPLLPMMLAACLALVFLQGAVHKLRDRHGFMAALQAYQVVPERLLGLGLLVPLLEAATGLLLLASPSRPWGAALAATLLLVYAMAMALNLRRGRSLDCGCGGAPQPLSWGLVIRNGIMILMAAGAALPVSGRPLEMADAWLMAGSVLAWLMLLAAVNQVLRQAVSWRRTSS